MLPATSLDVELDADPSLEFTVNVTVQAVNHYYGHSPPPAPVSIRYPLPNDTEFPDDADFQFRAAVPLVDLPSSDNESVTEPSLRSPQEPDKEPEYNFGSPGVQKKDPKEKKDKRTTTEKVSQRQAVVKRDSSEPNAGLLAGLLVLAIVAGLLTGLLLCYVKRHMTLKTYCKQQQADPPVMPECVVVIPPKKPASPPQTETKSSQTFDHSFYVMKCRRRTPTTCLRRDYEDRLRPNCHYAMKCEFERVPAGPTDAADDARSPHNAPLNRSQQVLPYDKNRVRLTRGRLADRSYINASLIRTVRHQPSVVVAQCPTEDTVADFWKMIWDLNIGSVVMLVPGDSRKYNGPVYWPRRTELPTVYSDVEVQLMTETARAHFVLRRFRLHGWEGECVVSRLVSQWQFLRWTALSSLPHHPVQFVDFLRDFQTKHSPDTGMVVHCNLGAGCSGIFLALDALSTEGRRTGQVDVEECATLLCLERMNLVRTFRQYRFIYFCLMELFDTGHDTCIPVSCFHFAYTNLTQRGKKSRLSHLDHEFCVLSFPCYGVDSQARSTCEKPYGNLNDSNSSRRPIADSNAACILDGYLTSQLFVIPRPGAQCAAEFWKAALDHDARTAVVLRPLDQSGLIVPCRGACSQVGEFLLECKHVRQSRDRSFVVYNLTVARGTDVGDPAADAVSWHPVRLYEFVAWPDCVELPDVGTVLDLVSHMAEWCRRDSQGRSTLFHVSQSSVDESRAAVVCTAWIVLDRIHAENLVDIYMAARYVSSFIPSAFSSLVSKPSSSSSFAHKQGLNSVGAGIPHVSLELLHPTPTRPAKAPLWHYVHVQIMIAVVLLSKCLNVRYFFQSNCKILKKTMFSGILQIISGN